jgi:phenylpropionate dioxygenase-like ring-hydroxylating dioxygenase large terminal subunit
MESKALPLVRFPRKDYTRVPFRVYHDPEIYKAEQELIFKGPTWSCVGLEVEVSNTGDFRTTFIGDTPVIFNRCQDGSLSVMVNRCAHRGAIVRREARGNASSHTCIYHRWCYNLDGSLQGLPFRRGIKGKGGMGPDSEMDARHRHNLTWSKIGTDNDAEFSSLYKDNKVHESGLALHDPSMVQYHREFEDRISLAICGIFPNMTLHQITNSLATRQVRTVSENEFELYWTLFGYADDSEEMTRHRLLQANMVGPAGLISMEDGEAIEITHRASRADVDACSVIEMGGGGPIHDLDHRINDVPCRGFWSYYAELMGLEPEGAVR